MTSLLLLFLFAQQPASPLADLQWMGDGQWNASAKLPNGPRIESRMVVDWGPGRMSLRMRIWAKQGDRFQQSYESLFYWHPHNKRIEYITFATDGTVFRGTATLQGTTLTTEQDATGNFPASRQVFAPDGEGKYTGTTYFKKGDAWVEFLKATSTRVKREKFAAPEKLSDKLATFDKLVGGKWSVSGEMMGQPMSATATHERSLRGTLLLHTVVMGGQPFFWTIVYAGKEKPRFLTCSMTGGLSVGDYTVGEDKWTIHGKSLLPTGQTMEYREVDVWKSDKLLEWQVFVKQGEEWQPVSGKMTSKRD
ncbi:MAG: hypothetical protein ACYTHK_10585 [Planctomycetota bacterium]